MEKIILKAITLLLVLSILNTSYPVWANENNQQVEIVNNNTQKTEDPVKLIPPVLQSTSVSGAVYDNDWVLTLQKINQKSLENSHKRLYKQNQYVYSKQELEEFVLNGVTEEDIYLSDLIGNEWMISPYELINRKREHKETWDEIETSLRQEKEEKLAELLLSNPDAGQALEKKSMSTAEKIGILEGTLNDSGRIIEQTIEEYQLNGLSALNQRNEKSKEELNRATFLDENLLEQSVSDSVYIPEDFVEQPESEPIQPFTLNRYAEDLNSIYNGLITQTQINQTNKPQYSDQNGTSEIIDPSSGKLLWKQNNISLPGRDGLDLNIGVINQSNYSYMYQKTYGTSGDLKKANYLLSRYDLGVGWAFQFPSIQLEEGGYLYYHKGDGAVFRIDLNANNNPDNVTHLVGYQGKDMKLMQDTQGLFTNGQVNSAYYLEYADKKREYFANDGILLGIVDRYGNNITFHHEDRTINDRKTYKVISSITDSIGRTVTFTYDTSLQNDNETFNGEGIVVAVKDLNGIVTQTVTYMKSRSSDTFNGVSDGYSPILWYIQNQNNDTTYFTNENFQNNKFDYLRSEDSIYAGWVTLHPLKTIYNSNSYTHYQFEKVTRRLGSNGFSQEYRTTSRKDQIKRNAIAAGNFNQVNYNYSGDYTGFNPANPYSNPSSFLYSTTQTVISTSPTGGMATTINYNNIGQVTSISTRASNGERKLVSNVAFDATYISMPTVIENRIYESDNDSSPNVLYIEKQYTDWGGVKSETVPLTQTQYNNATTKSKYTTSYTYDPTYYFLITKSGYQNDNILQTERYDYFSNGRIKSYTNAKGEVTNFCYEGVDSSGGQTSNCSTSSMNVVGKVTKIKTTKNLGEGQLSISELIFNSSTVYAYPSEVRSYFTIKTVPNITQLVQSSMNYNMGNGTLESEINGDGKVTSYQYDALGRTTMITYPSFTNANGVGYNVMDEITYSNSVIPSSADAYNAYVSSILVSSKRKYTQKSNNVTTAFAVQNDYYDAFGFLRYSQKSNNGETQTTQYRPDDLTRAVYAIDPMNNTTTVTYDAWGAQKEAIDIYGNLYVSESNLKLRKENNYFIAVTDIPAYRDNQILNKNALKSNYIERDYDQWGQLLVNRVFKDWPNQTIPLTELYSYDLRGNLITYTDPKRNLNNESVTTKYTYDILNRLIEVKDALGQIVKYSYNKSGQITDTSTHSSEFDSPTLVNTKKYNELGGLIYKEDPSFIRETYDYNNLGLLQQLTDRNGTKSNYQYDEQNRPILLTLTRSGAASEQVKSIFGSNGIRSDTQEYYKNGVKSSSLTTQKDYLERLTSIQVQGANNTFSSSLGIEYDLNNRITELNISGGASNSFHTQFKYDRLQLEKVQTNGQQTLNNSDAVNVKYTYYPNGRVKSLSYPPLMDGSILKTEYVYDKLERLDTITNKKGSTLLSSYSYKYDNNGNIETVLQSEVNQMLKVKSYTYDKLNRLLTITSVDKTVVYTYDVQGNRLTLSDTSNVPLILDERSYEYDLHNNLIKNTNGNEVTTFEYSPDKLRYRKAKGSDIKQYRYNLNSEVISEVNGNNVVTANYVRGDRLLVKKDIAMNKDYYYLYNGHGDVIQMVDTNGEVINSYEYDEWGKITKKTEGIANEFKYAGEIYDEETGLYYLRARYYDPNVGRFINEDTYEGEITNPLSLNLYTYVHNNPLLYIDPTGNWATVITANWTINEMKWKYQEAYEQGNKEDMRYWSSEANKLRELIRNASWFKEQGLNENDIMQSTDKMIPEDVVMKLARDSTIKWIESDENGFGLYANATKVAVTFLGRGAIKYGNKVSITAREIITKTKKGAINKEFPSQWVDKTMEEIERAAKQGDKDAKKAKKLLTDKRFDKTDNRK
ncbi:RHS repeat domain-containing protein [Paenibacillus sinopodophylli]|uniref:RHS repeat domain-containing protein n=1 Tax=Paenibacillus sinopodophylli TaxID=1837342 RepID=UPI00110C9D27|nr:RHS repeat-associated core domain-containing protein [Paenibacillus sinopodophylli]